MNFKKIILGFIIGLVFLISTQSKVFAIEYFPGKWSFVLFSSSKVSRPVLLGSIPLTSFFLSQPKFSAHGSTSGMWDFLLFQNENIDGSVLAGSVPLTGFLLSHKMTSKG
jgi:hypothetical protein